MKKHLFPVLTVLILVFCLFPAQAFADGGPAKGDTVYFGSYEGSPLAWQVLDPDAENDGSEGLFLLSKYVLDNGKVMYDGGLARWEDSDARLIWCPGFLDAAFSADEQAAIPAVSKSEEGFQAYGLSWGAVTLEDEKVFFLSTRELSDYIAPNDGDAGISATTADGTAASWWLRTPHGFHPDYAGLVLDGNEVHDFLVYGSWGVRPVMNIAGAQLLFASPARGTATLGAFSAPGGDGSGEWKLTVTTEDDSFSVDAVTRDGDALRVEYSGAPTGDGRYLSALIREPSGAVTAYAPLQGLTSPAGTLELDLNSLPMTEDDTLFLFAETWGGNLATNVAGKLQEIQLPEPVGEVLPEEVEAPAADALPAPAEVTPAPAAPAAAQSGFGALFLRFGPVLALILAVLALIMGIAQSARRRRRRR